MVDVTGVVNVDFEHILVNLLQINIFFCLYKDWRSKEVVQISKSINLNSSKHQNAHV